MSAPHADAVATLIEKVDRALKADAFRTALMAVGDEGLRFDRANERLVQCMGELRVALGDVQP